MPKLPSLETQLKKARKELILKERELGGASLALSACRRHCDMLREKLNASLSRHDQLLEIFNQVTKKV